MATPDHDLLPLSSGDAAQSSYFNEIATATDRPSTTAQFLPLSQQSPVMDLQDPIMSPTALNMHPLPARRISQSPGQSATPNITQSSNLAPTQTKPRIVGGFEVDTDPEDEDGAQDETDEADVYDPAAGLSFDAPTPADAPAHHIPNSLDRTSQSPEQENGITPVPVQATGSPTDAEISSSTTIPLGASTDLHAPRAATATPSYTAPEIPTQTSPLRSHVNDSVAAGLPKSRLAHDVVGILEDRIKDDPRGDIDAYLELIDEFKSRNKQEEVRRVYEEYIKVFPFAVCSHSLSSFLRR